MRYRSRFGDSNLNGRSYGGQVLGQAMMAASLSVAAPRLATTFQLLFLKGADPVRPVEFAVTALQDGKRFSSRHVRGLQDGSTVCDAIATFALPLSAPEHADETSARETSGDDVPTPFELPGEAGDGLRRLRVYPLRGKPSMDFRIPDVSSQVAAATAGSSFRFWLKARRTLPNCEALHAAAFAYLSDWWLNFSAIGLHARELASDQNLYIASLNHSIWFHRAIVADEWLHFDSHSPISNAGRGFSIANVHDRRGKRMATITQESLMSHA